jgi:NAD(P)H-hydrate repair Nnr-like enzyme with NAD(P)H-hydrate epimerase domain
MIDTEQMRTADVIGTLTLLSRGHFIIDCGHELQELTDAIKETNKEGKLTITLKITPSGWKKGTGRANQVDIAPSVTISKPQHDQPKSIFFLTEDENKLVRDDPDQELLFGDRR